jgi:hypothetical protein
LHAEHRRPTLTQLWLILDARLTKRSLLPSSLVGMQLDPANVEPSDHQAGHGMSRRALLGSALVGGLGALGLFTSQSNAAASKTKSKTKTPPTTKKKTATTPAPAKGPAAIAAGSELVISYSYVANEGRIHNPYVAVWIEDTASNAVRTVHLEIQKGRGGLRWIEHLTRWISGDDVRKSSGGKDIIDTVSSPTRFPGTYSVSWDGKSDTGANLPSGDYYVCVESARERGPYELVREKLTFDGSPVSKTFTDNGSLHGVKVELRSKA